jgi:hypothetical protein
LGPEDLAQVMSYRLQDSGNQNVAADLTAAANLLNAPYDPTQPDRRTAVLALAVEEFRAAIRLGARTTVAATASTVPPETVRYVLQLAAFNLIHSDLNLKSVIVTEEGGVWSPIKVFYDAAIAEKKRLGAGGLVTVPTDPEETLIPLSGGAGDIVGMWDMTTDNPVTTTTT